MSHGVRLVGGLTLSPGSSAEILWRDEGVDIAERGIANFIGAGVTVVDDPANLEVDITVTDSLQIAYNGGPTITTNAGGTIQITKGALSADGSGIFALQDLNANPGRSAHLVSIVDQNVTGIEAAAVYISQNLTSSRIALYIDRLAQAAGAATQAHSSRLRMNASMWTGAAEAARPYELYAFAPTAADEAGVGRASLAIDYNTQRLLRVRGAAAAPGAAQGAIFENDVAIGAEIPFRFVATAGNFAANVVFEIADSGTLLEVAGDGRTIFRASASATDPMIAFAGALTTGIAYTAADATIHYVTAGVNRISLEANGQRYEEITPGVAGSESYRAQFFCETGPVATQRAMRIFAYGNPAADNFRLVVRESIAAADVLWIESTGQIVGVAGSVTLPTYSTTGDPDTGIYFPAANQVGVTVGGSAADAGLWTFDTATTTYQRTVAGIVGPELRLSLDKSIAAAVGDTVALLSFYGEDSAGNQTEYGQINAVATVVTDLGEYGALNLRVMDGGTVKQLFRIEGDGSGGGVFTNGKAAAATPAIYFRATANYASTQPYVYFQNNNAAISPHRMFGQGDLWCVSTDAGSTGPELQLYQDSASPLGDTVAGDDLGDNISSFSCYGEDDGSVKTLYAQLRGHIVSPASPNEEGSFQTWIMTGGTLVKVSEWRGGNFIMVPASLGVGADSRHIQLRGNTNVGAVATPRNIDVFNETDAGGDTYRVRINNNAGTIMGTLDESGNLILTGNISLASGLATSPSIYATADTDTGLYWAPPDVFGITVGGAASLTCSTTAVIVESETAGGGSDSRALQLEGRTSAAYRVFNFINEADAGTDTYRLRIKDNSNLYLLTIESDGSLYTFERTTGGINGPELRLYHNKTAVGADGDNTGQIKFYGEDDGNNIVEYAGIYAIVADATVATGVDGAMSLRIRNAGAVTEVFRISSEGTPATTRIGFFNTTPAAQSAAIIDAAGGSASPGFDAEARTAINTLLAYCRLNGFIAT